MDITQMRAKSNGELERFLAEEQMKLEDLRFRASARELKNIHEIRHTRHAIARVLTVLRERVGAAQSVVGEGEATA